MTGTVELDMIIALSIGALVGVGLSALIWWLSTRQPADPALVSLVTQPAIEDRLYEIETNGEADLAKLAAREGVAFDGAGDPGEAPKPYKAGDIPF